MARPIDFAPPFGARDAVGAPTDPKDERIEVGVLIVGAGPGGLACAIRLGQLLEEHPDVRERLGDVPIAVLEKGKQAGSHLLSGAVMNPSPLRDLFRGRLKTADFPTYGEVPGEAVYVLTRRSAMRIPPPPTMRNHGNLVVSLSELGRFLGEQAEALGAVVLPETAATKLLVEHGRVVGVRTGDRGRGRQGEALPTFEPGNDVVAPLTVLAEGTQGYLTGAAIDQFGLHGENPQIWALGVKEVWRVPKPLRKIIHTMGWPLRTSASFGEFGGSFIYPMGDELVTVGFVAGLETTDVEFSVHDVLQEFKTHRLVWKILGGGERVAWGAKTITEGGYHSLPRRFNAPGLLLVGEGAGLVNVPRLKGVHYAIESGRLAAEAAFRALQRGEVPSRTGALDSYDDALRESKGFKELYEVRNMRQAFDKGFFAGRRARERDDGVEGADAERPLPDAPERGGGAQEVGTRVALPQAGRHVHLRQALVGLRVGEPHARRPAEPPEGPNDGAPPGRRGMAVDVPGARVRGRTRRRRRDGARRDHALELRPVRRHHRQGRQAHAARGRLRARVHPHLGVALRGRVAFERSAHARAIATRSARAGACRPSAARARRVRVAERLLREPLHQPFERGGIRRDLERLPVRLGLHAARDVVGERCGRELEDRDDEKRERDCLRGAHAAPAAGRPHEDPRAGDGEQREPREALGKMALRVVGELVREHGLLLGLVERGEEHRVPEDDAARRPEAVRVRVRLVGVRAHLLDAHRDVSDAELGAVLAGRFEERLVAKRDRS